MWLLSDFLLLYRDSPPYLYLCCLCRVHRCSTAPSTAERSPSAGVGVLRSRGWCPCQSGGGWAPLRPGASEGSPSHHRRASLTTPSTIPWCNVWLPPFRKKSEGTLKVTFYFSFRGVHKTIENCRHVGGTPTDFLQRSWTTTTDYFRLRASAEFIPSCSLSISWIIHDAVTADPCTCCSRRAAKRWTCCVCVTQKLISWYIF